MTGMSRSSSATLLYQSIPPSCRVNPPVEMADRARLTDSQSDSPVNRMRPMAQKVRTA